jgi:site-specific DNA recombinase
MRPIARITEEKIAAFVNVVRTDVLSGETPFRRAYIRSIVDRIEFDNTEIRIMGPRTVLERLVMGDGAAPAGVHSFVQKWRARQDSNL